MTNIKRDILWRVVFGMGAVVIFAGLILFQMFKVQVLEGEKWLSLSDSITIHQQDISASRGNIFSDDGSLLSTSMPIYEIRWDATVPSSDTFKTYVDQLAIGLSEVFPDNTASYYRTMLLRARRDKNRYTLIRRRVTYSEQKVLKKLPLFNKGRYKGGYLSELTTKRVKPAGQLAYRTIGYSTIDNPGVGLERAYNSDLGGVKGKRIVQRISGGYRPVNDENLLEPQNGRDVHTTINIDFQEITQRSLEKALLKHKADHGSVIVMEVATGKIKAISNLRVTETGEFVEQYNSAIGESYEPGSVWKVFSAMAAFEDELIDLDDSLDIQNGERDYFGKPMQDSDKGRFQKMSFTQAFARSSNVAFSSIIFDNYNKNPSKYLAHLKTLDLDKKTGIEILGEPKPFLNHPSSSSWSKLTLPWLAIGYENQHTPLQLLAAYNGIINDGKMIKPRLVNEVTDAGLVIKDNNKKVKEVTVCSKETSDKIKKLTAAVFIDGSASNVKSNVVALAGKTGTAQIASGGAYQTTKLYNASFVGHFPADKPAYSIYVMINRPSNGAFYASYVAAPVFAEIAEKIYTISVKQEVNASVKKAPTYTAGYVSDFNILSRYLNISLNEEIDGEVVRIDATKGTAKNVVVNTGIMPNVKGLGAKDAMYLLEMQGLKPLISGYGRVMEQSPNPGVRVIKNQRVRIQLK